MALLINVEHLADRTVHLQGHLTREELDIDPLDKVIEMRQPLDYELHVTRINRSLFITGHLKVVLNCVCVRCLEPFEYTIELTGDLFELPLTGEEAPQIVGECIDLTPYVRENILLEFPAHPVCGPNCRGVPEGWVNRREIGKNRFGSVRDILENLQL
jgi:uncharacterized protein